MKNIKTIELNDERLLTTEQLAEVYGTNEKSIRDNFQNNRSKFLEDKHFKLLEGNDLKDFKSYAENIGIPINKFTPQLYLWTKRGASRHSKMLGTDQAWDMFDSLEESYFNPGSKLPVLTIEEMMIQQLQTMTEVKTDVAMLKNEIDLSRNQKAKLSREVRSNSMKAVGGKKARAYTLYYRVAISEHWKEIKDYFEVAAYEEIPKLQFNDAMELASMWHPSAELALKIKKANTQTELFDEVV
ncbi:ORF6C domain-containing protein [Carnobacterium maltaromaticum]|uniref:ORF6C domain-containing protein n=1 Tax=Carnobacterium maltaromaticum TaxID=2751 RepID=UPI001431C597|nr:ORF6C domain-containing protein [Carnobacterium maltaromaticum]